MPGTGHNCNLVLSGGGVRGYAHIGAIKALMEKGLTFSALSGTSAGAMIGAFICDGFGPDEIAEIILKEEPKPSFNYRGIREGFLSFNSFTKTLKKNLRSKELSQLRIPLYVTATDLHTGAQKIFSEGNIIEVLSASSAIPLLVPPVYVNGIPYGDGGMSNNLPTEPFNGSDLPLVGIHVNPVVEFQKHGGLMHTIDRSMHIIVRNNILSKISQCDVFIEPPALVKYHILERKRSSEIIRVGYDHVINEVKINISDFK
jgi:NTE family protein